MSGSKVVKKEIDTTRFRADCELDLGVFKDILTKNISSQLRCLGENLNIYVKVVKTDRPGYINLTAFEAYLRNHQTGITPEVLNALKQVFELNYLLRGEDREYISKENVDELIDLVIVFNEEMALNFAPIFQSKKEVSYALHNNHKSRIREATNKITVALLKTFRPDRGGRIDRLDILKLVEAFLTDDSRDIIEKIKNVLFIKKVLMGGENEVITHVELLNIIYSFPDIAELCLDVVRYKYVLVDQEEIISILKQDIENLSEVILNPKLGNRNEEVFFTLDNLFEAVKLFFSSETFDIDKFRNLIIYGKKILMSGNGKMVSGADFKTLLDHCDKILKEGVVFHKMYDKYRVSLDSKQPVAINYEEAIIAFPGYPDEVKKFIRITSQYRFMKGSSGSAYYTNEWMRNADAVFEIGIYEYLINLVFSFEDTEVLDADGKPTSWGTKFPYAGTTFTHAVNQTQLQNIVKLFKDELVAIGLILPHKEISTADTISLLGTLFQYQSDENVNPKTKKGSPILDVNETTEFAVSLMNGISMADKLMKKFEATCGTEIDKFKRVSPVCFKKNFLKFFCEDYRKHYPLLFESLGSSVCDIPETEYNSAYLDMTIKASRTCMFYEDENHKPTEEIYYSESDMMSIIVAIMHVEATFLRWDKNKNNILDVNEVEDAYSIYSWALDGFLSDMPSYIRIFKKQIYQYMVKFEEVPSVDSVSSTMKFVKFLLSPHKKTSATRKTFGSLLWGISEENRKTRIANGTETFKCNWLKNPDDINPDRDNDEITLNLKETYAPLLNLIEIKGKSEIGEPIFAIRKNKCIREVGKEYCSEEGGEFREKRCFSMFGRTIFCL